MGGGGEGPGDYKPLFHGKYYFSKYIFQATPQACDRQRDILNLLGVVNRAKHGGRGVKI
jgi:hypothetical protein